MTPKEQIDSNYLLKKGFEVSRYWGERDQQFRLVFKKEGYDGILMIFPVMQVVPNDGNWWMSPEEQVEEFSAIEDLLDHNIGDWNICLNGIENHISTFRYKKQLEDFINLTQEPFDN